MLPFKYDTYQDVRHALAVWFAPLLAGEAFLFFQFALPSAYQKAVLGLLEWLTSNPLLKGITWLAIVGVLAVLLVEMLKIHDHVYDRFVVRWRKAYDTLFILPRMVRPFANRLSPKFFKEAVEHRDTFMPRLFYAFVQDRDAKIGKNFLVRFYERVALYWFSQLIEMTLVGAFVAVGVMWYLNQDNATYVAQVPPVLLAIAAIFTLNRWLISLSLPAVRQATEAEINAVHEEHMADFEARLKAVCQDYGVPFDDAPPNQP